MPTFGDETLHDRYAREHADHMARLARMTPEQIAELELSLHNALAEVDRLRAQAQAAPEAEPVEWIRRSDRFGCKQYMTDRQYQAQSALMKANYEPYSCARCTAPQPDAELVQLLKLAAWNIRRSPSCQESLVPKCACRKCVLAGIDAKLATLSAKP